jgi:hypothetical protein
MPRSPAKTQEFLRVARERFKQGQDATEKQRQRELADLAFYAGGDHQWSRDAIESRKGQNATGNLPPIPARPMITVNKVREPVHQILNQERQSDLAVELVPADDFGALVGPLSEDEIELREGLVRRIQRDSEAADARTWAFMRATIAGAGYYRILTRYVKGTRHRDKEVVVSRIYNQASVTLDPAHEQPDGSDCDWEFIETFLAEPRYRSEYPKVDGSRNALSDLSDADFNALGVTLPDWFKTEGDTRMYRVVEYFYTERETQTLVLLTDGTEVPDDEIEDESLVALDKDGHRFEREDVEKRVKWAKIDGQQILDETDWESPDMPIIKVLGEELQPFDQERRVEGMVRPARGSQEGFNAMVTKLVETIGLTPVAPLSIAEGQVEGYERWYQLANTRALPYLPYRPTSFEGHLVGPPAAVNRDTPVQALAEAVQMFDEAIKSTTLVPSVQLGQATDARLKSGKAIQLMQDQAQLGTSNYMDNLQRSVRYEGQVLNNLLYPIYGKRPGRIARMLNGENEPVTVQIGANGNGQAIPSGVVGARTTGGGALQPGVAGPSPLAPMAAGPRAAAPGPPQTPKPPKTYTLTKDANFNVIVKVTRGFDSRRTEEATTIGNLLQANPMFMTWFGDLFFANQDGPGHEEMSKRAEVMLDPKIQQMRQQQQGAEIPSAFQAQYAQLQARLQHAEQILGQAKQELESKQQELTQKHQTAIQQTQMETDRAIQLAHINNAAKIRVAELAAKKDLIAAEFEDQEERLATGATHLHEAGQAELDRQHERDQAAQAHANALEQGAAGVAGTIATQTNQAALQPPEQPEQAQGGGQ